jgi:hypothetical protein
MNRQASLLPLRESRECDEHSECQKNEKSKSPPFEIHLVFGRLDAERPSRCRHGKSLIVSTLTWMISAGARSGFVKRREDQSSHAVASSEPMISSLPQCRLSVLPLGILASRSTAFVPAIRWPSCRHDG